MRLIGSGGLAKRLLQWKDGMVTAIFDHVKERVGRLRGGRDVTWEKCEEEEKEYYLGKVGGGRGGRDVIWEKYGKEEYLERCEGGQFG